MSPRVLLSAVVVVVAIASIAATQAEASPLPDAAPVLDSSLDPSCVQAVASVSGSADEVESLCRVTIESSVSSESSVSAEEAATISDPDVGDRASLVASARAGTLRSKSWDQVKYGGTYKEVHKGTFWYDGAKAWSKEQTYRGKRGSHSCGSAGSWGLGVNVATVSCTQPRSGTAVVNRETYKVQAVANGSPINWTLAMSMLLKANGSTQSRAS